MLFFRCVYCRVRYYDCHTHQACVEADRVSVRNVRLGAASVPEYCLRSVGIHPWDAATTDMGMLDKAIGHDGVVAIGETGLDRACGVSWSAQEHMFTEHIRRSEQHRLPLIIHCVRAFDDVIRMRTVHRATMPWILHGFNKSGDVIDRLVEADMYVSFGGALLRDGSPATSAIRRLPSSRIFLETDDDADLRIADVYAAAASLLNVSIEDLCTTQHENFKTVFKQ